MEEIIRIPVHAVGNDNAVLELARDPEENFIRIVLDGKELCWTEWLESLQKPLMRALKIWRDDGYADIEEEDNPEGRQ